MSAGAFLYYFPGVTIDQVTREWLRQSPVAEPLRDVWERKSAFDTTLHKTAVINGPDGAGALIAAIGNREDDPQAALYQPEHQQWENVGTHWIGIDKRYPPDATSLERPRVVPGINHELATGGVWHLPIIRSPDPETLRPTISNLPLVRTAGAAVKLPERYLQIWELTGKLFAWMMFGTPVANTRAESAVFLFDAAATCLGVNYRVGPHEIGMLECLEDDDEAAILRAAVDMDSVETIIRERNRGNTENPTSAPG